MLRTRVLTALVLAGILLTGLFVLPPHSTVLLFGAVFTLGAWEWAGFASLKGAQRWLYTGLIALSLLFGWFWSAQGEHLFWLLAAACGWWIVALLWLSLAPARHQAALTLVCGLPVLVPAFLAVARLQVTTRGIARGPQIVLWLVLLVIAADIGAYFAGRSLGRRKLAPRVSPGKTVEGAVGGLVLVAAVAGAAAAHFSLPALSAVIFGCAVGICSIVGDLTESMFKRAAGLKDSGSLLPGHGGLLDRIDGFTAAAPLYALGLLSSGAVR
jgi:phosphatidate cytidylyltransferase